MIVRTKHVVLTALGLLAAMLIRRTRTRRKTLGRTKSLQMSALEAGAALVQRLTPIEQINVYLDGFHFQSGQLGHQTRTCHYCTVLNEDVMQCIIFDSAGAGARLLGVEYIISEPLFRALPEDEKPLWHSHAYDVRSGQLAAPGLPAWAQLELMEQIQATYGKTWQTWDTVYDTSLPLGLPKLMMSFTEDGQLQPELLAERDRLLGISAAENRKRRSRLPPPRIADGANAWERGEVLQVQLAQTGMTFNSKHETKQGS
jgi:Protein of unknown function (DUF1264)